MGSEQQVNEQELTATALVIPPRGRAVLCLWAAVPGLLAAPFVFWQGLGWGLAFSALWALFVAAIRVRACSFVAALGPRALTIQLGVAFSVRRTLPRRAVTSALQFRTPLLRLAGLSVLVLFTPGFWVVLPAVPRAQADALAAVLLADRGPEDAA